jgi:uncharacterized protein YbjT (DUF2867 family)
MFLSKLMKKIRKARVNENASANKKVIVVGASGYVGKATLAALTSRHFDTVQTFAGVRSPEKFGTMEKVTTISTDMGDKAALTQTFRGFDSVFLVVPGHEDRTQLAINGLEAAKDAGVRFVLVLSVLTSGTDSIFGKQFAPIEAKAKKIGVNYAIVRLPLFIDNNWAHLGSIKGQDAPTFYDPRDPTTLHTPVAVNDVGKAAADILANPVKHYGKTYKLVAPPFSLNDMASAFTKAMGKQVKHTQVSYKDAKDAFMGMGFPEWQVDGIMELYQYIDSESTYTNERTQIGDVEAITGEAPQSIESWVEQNVAGFQ